MRYTVGHNDRLKLSIVIFSTFVEDLSTMARIKSALRLELRENRDKIMNVDFP